jgi:hypothetical protein
VIHRARLPKKLALWMAKTEGAKRRGPNRETGKKAQSKRGPAAVGERQGKRGGTGSAG